MVVYVDVLVVTNNIVNLLLLRCCARFSGIPIRRLFAILAALAGAAGSLVIFLPPASFPVQLALRGGIAFVMILIAYPGQTLGTTLRLLLILFVSSFLLAGGCLALWFLLGDRVVYWNNGVSYFPIRPMTLILSTAGVYGVVWVFERAFRSRQGNELYTIEAWRNGRKIRFSGREDSGNLLVEPFSGLPVVVCPAALLEGLADPREARWLRDPGLEEPVPKGCRLVAFHSVGGGGFLGAVRPDRLSLCREGEGRWVRCDGYLAASSQLGEDGPAVFNPHLLRLKV